MHEILNRLGALRLVPVVKIDRADDAAPLAEALLQGGLPCAEITFRTAAAAEAIRRASAVPGMLVGAGTVLSPAQVDDALAAGAQFIVSPGFNPKVVGYCVEKGVPITPGTSNPTDIEMALEFGLEVVKFFPAEAFGGLKTLKAISAPYGMVRFMPTGGIDPQNLAAYLGFAKVLACGGSWMVKEDLLAARDFASIARLTAEAVKLAQAARP